MKNPMKPLVNYSYGKFISDIQYLELIKDLIASDEGQTHRAAFYLADQFVEVLMLRLLKAQIISDSELVAIIQPQIDQEKVIDINKYHAEKIKWLKRLKLINSLDAEKIRAIHLYRNLSYHNEEDNEAIFPVLSSLSLSIALKLFKNYYSITLTEIHFGSREASSLKKYSLPTDMINYKFASQVIIKELEKKLLNKIQTEKVLKEDIRHRLGAISMIRSELSWLKSDYIFDGWIKVAEFFDVHPYDKFSKGVYEVHYEIAHKSKNGKKIEEETSMLLRKKKVRREATRDKKINKLLTAYRQSVSSHSIRQASNFLKVRFSNFPLLLARYKELDKQIRRLEFLLEKIEEEFDREVQREIDHRRGK